MIEKEIAIYASIYAKNLEEIEIVLKKIFGDNFKTIEQGSVLLFADPVMEFSIEYHNNSFYMSGRYKGNFFDGELLIKSVASNLKESEIPFSIDYQEENIDRSLSAECNISYGLEKQ